MGRALDNANALVKFMTVGRQPSARAKQSVAAAHFDSGHQGVVEKIDERGPLTRIEAEGQMEPIHSLKTRSSRTERIIGHLPWGIDGINNLTRRVRGRKCYVQH